MLKRNAKTELEGWQSLLWLALSFLVGIAFVPLDSQVQVVVAAKERSLAVAFAAPFLTLFLPMLAIAASSGRRPLIISISTLLGVVSGVVAFALIFGFPRQALSFWRCLWLAFFLVLQSSRAHFSDHG